MKLYDTRWCANHGIGRFSKEILSFSPPETISGRFDDIFSPFDPIRLLAKCLLNNSWYISPSYNCPLFWHRKSIITIHDLMHINFPEYAGLKNKIYYEYLVKPVCEKSPLIFTVSEYTKNEIVQWCGVDPEKIVVVYNGVDDKYHVNVKPYKHVRPYLFYVGDKKMHKNIYRLLSAYKKSDAMNSHDLILSGSENDEIIKWVNELDIAQKVKFSGFIPENDLPGYYKGATALVFPSLYEGFGLPIIEAMAVGTPVLTSNVTSMPEIAGNAAWLVDPKDISDISNGINVLVTENSVRSKLIEKGLERATMFNWERSREIWNSSIEAVVGAKN
ncbi:glycosyltransferase family 4 protein [Kangiella sp.]|uniref:glycosyltransferase family 4 protein n=1 Tax=Kangiella sp. TaxID=1920245 RepID=UPI003A8D0107